MCSFAQPVNKLVVKESISKPSVLHSIAIQRYSLP